MSSAGNSAVNSSHPTATSFGSNGDSRPPEMKELIRLVREKLLREPHSSTAPTTPATPAPKIAGQCWLCGKDTESKFRCIEKQPLCLGCFQICYTATLRPLLMGDSQGYELAQRVDAARLGTEDCPKSAAKEALTSGVFLNVSRAQFDDSNGSVGQKDTPTSVGMWRCPRCTFNNPKFMSYCEVCDAGSPVTVTCNHCGVPCSNSNASPVRSTINRPVAAAARGAVGVAARQQQPPPAVSAASICPSYNIKHEVWECEACTFVNTLECRACTMCQTNRVWTCTTCRYDKNTSRRSSNGERHCSQCGAVDRQQQQVSNSRAVAPPGGENNNNPAAGSNAPLNGSATLAGSSTLSDSIMRRIGLDPAEQKRERERADRLEQNKNRLDNRLRSLGLQKEIQLGDGNCQFRSLSHQLFGTPEHHMLLRHLVMLHIWKEKAFYEALFDTHEEFSRYWKTMSQSGTWGDEITLRAAADTFGVHLHVITSDEQRWHLHFAPAGAPETEIEEAPPASQSTFTNLQHKKESHFPHLFLLYLAPVHYDDIVRPAKLPNFAQTLTAILQRLKVDESDWDDALEDPKKKRSMNNEVDWVEVDRQTSHQVLQSPIGLPVSGNSLDGGGFQMIPSPTGSGSHQHFATAGPPPGSSGGEKIRVVLRK